MRLFWWNTHPNLGDTLSWLILGGYGFEVRWAPPAEAEWVSIGSVLGWFDGFTGTVFGSGRSGDQGPVVDLTGADVRALRGRLTRELVRGGNDAVLGDPGLLITDFIEKPPTDTYTAIVPHWQDIDRMVNTYPNCVLADVTGPAADAINVIASAERVISSSLHGIVLADAYGLPRMWDYFDGTQSKGFKFRDYGTVVGGFEPGQWHRAKGSLIEETKEALRSCLT